MPKVYDPDLSTRSMYVGFRLEVGPMISRAERGYEATSVNVAGSEHRRIPAGNAFLIERVAFDANEPPFV
jgi:hypothetical protein